MVTLVRIESTKPKAACVNFGEAFLNSKTRK